MKERFRTGSILSEERRHRHAKMNHTFNDCAYHNSTGVHRTRNSMMFGYCNLRDQISSIMNLSS